MKCVVSGATGFIGRQLCQQLFARGDTVVALSKSGAPLCNGEATVALDLAKDDPGPDLLRDVDVFFHLAGIAHQRAPESDYLELNLRATVRLARLASEAGVGCFIFLSSVKAMGSPRSSETRAENACTLPANAYGLSKWQAECVLREQFSDARMSVAIMRPALVYGAGVKGNLQQLARGVRRGMPTPPAGGRRSMIALDDLVELLCVVAHSPPAGVHTWIACESESYSTRAIYDLMRKAMGKGRGASWLPRWGWRVATGVLDVVNGRAQESTYSKLFGTEVYSNALVVDQTTWRPRLHLEDVIGQIAGAGKGDA